MLPTHSKQKVVRNKEIKIYRKYTEFYSQQIKLLHGDGAKFEYKRSVKQ